MNDKLKPYEFLGVRLHDLENLEHFTYDQCCNHAVEVLQIHGFGFIARAHSGAWHMVKVRSNSYILKPLRELDRQTRLKYGLELSDCV